MTVIALNRFAPKFSFTKRAQKCGNILDRNGFKYQTFVFMNNYFSLNGSNFLKETY